ncbi:MAG: right-handed parallel beta-helix repeat-containing protein [Armatimonadota bacterium]
MNKIILAVLSFVSMAVCSSAIAEDIPVYAEVSSVKELRDSISQLKGLAGGAIYIRAGTYVIEEPLVINGVSHVSIFGAGIGKTILKKTGNGNVINFTGPCNSCSVRNMSIVADNNAKEGSGIVLSDTDWSGLTTIDSCLIEGFPENGVYFAGRDLTPQSSCTVSNCIIKNNRKAQIYDNANNDYYFIRNHLIVDNESARESIGIYLRYASAGTISYNYIEKCRIGVQLDKASSMNRLEHNIINDCTESAFDCGMVTTPSYDISTIPRESFYTGWEWSIPHEVRICTEDVFFNNTIYASGKNPAFCAINSRTSAFINFVGNKIIAGRPIKSVIGAGSNRMTWIVTGNTISGKVSIPFDTADITNLILSRNVITEDGVGKVRAPKIETSVLSKQLLKVISNLNKPSDKVWFRKVQTVSDLEKAVRDLPETGGTIYITAGNYRLTGSLSIKDKNNVTIIGSGLGTFLKGIKDADLISFEGKCNNCYIGNLNIMPDIATPWKLVDMSKGSGVLFKGAGTGFSVDYCIIDNWPVSCIRIEGNPENTIKKVTITGNWIIRGKETQLYMTHCRDFNVSDNQYGYVFEDKLPIGAYFAHCSDGLYELNYHWGNKIGLWFDHDCSDIKILENRSEQSRVNGMLLGTPEGGLPNRRFVIEGNTFHTNPELDPGTAPNVAAYNTSNVKFLSNQIYTWWSERKSTNGLELDDNCKDWELDSNYFRDYLKDAVKYNNKNNIKFRNNIFDHPQRFEIQL